MGDDSKICLICGIDTMKKARYERYNLPPESITKRKSQTQMVDSDSDSQDFTSKSKGKRGSTQKTPAKVTKPTTSGRTTRNQNPKSHAASMCKVLKLPATSDHPFLGIFSAADYCTDCSSKVKEIHTNQMELEKVQAKLAEARVDLELDLSKHLQKIPFCKTVLRTNVFERYKHDIDLILDFHDPKNRNKRGSDDEPEEEEDDDGPKKPPSSLKRKREGESNGARKSNRVKVQKEEAVDLPSSDEIEGSGIDEDESANGNSVQEKLDEEADVAGEEDAVKIEEAEIIPLPSEEVKVEPKAKVKKDPNLKCPHCVIPRHFLKPQSLAEHILKSHNKPFACDVCERKFVSERDVQRHKETVHDGEAFYACGFCDQPFKQKRYLEDHLDSHGEAKPLNCSYCGRGFKRQESLQKGFQIYKGEPVEPCRNCNRNLNLKDYLEHNKNLK